MSDIEEFFFEGTNFSKEQIALARLNYLAQADLAAQLGRAAEESGVSIEDAAVQLGWDAEKVDQAVHGMHDVSLTELRLMANTFDASVHFRVAPRYSFHTKLFAAEIAHLGVNWVESKSWSDPQLTSSTRKAASS